MAWLSFVPIVAGGAAPTLEPIDAPPPTVPVIEVRLAGAVLRVESGTDRDLLTTEALHSGPRRIFHHLRGRYLSTRALKDATEDNERATRCSRSGPLPNPMPASEYALRPAGTAEALEWLEAAQMGGTAASCPNCGDVGAKGATLRAPWPGRTGQNGRAALLRCGACGCGFFHPAEAADYGAEPPGGGGAMAFYLQQGAGLWGITANLEALGRPPGSRLLEVGCGFGFGLDFARRALGWEVMGLDPGPFAAAGRAQLGLPIESRYLVPGDRAFAGRFDVLTASEVLEHVPSPPDFARTLHGALREGGSLVLTTPDFGAVAPDTPPGLLVPLLSIGYHLVLQSEGSLAALLRGAGFEEVEVRRAGGSSLVARARRGGAATPAPLPAASPEADDAGRPHYRRYLRDAAEAAEAGGDLQLGLLARAYREAVNAADLPEADALWDHFGAACERRFGARPAEDGEAVPAPASAETLDALAAREPLCLGPVLLHRALHRLLAGASREATEKLFRHAADAVGRLRAALRAIGTDDGDAEDAAWVASAEALLCAAERGAEGVPALIAALGPAPGDAAARREGRPLRTDAFRRRLFVSLVNAGRLEDSDTLADAVETVGRGGGILGDGELDALFCAAARELQRPAETSEAAAERALGLLRRLGDAAAAARAAGRGGSAETLPGPAREAELLALEVLGRWDEAEALRAAQRPGGTAP